MTAYHSNGERSKSPSGQQERVTEGDKDESPRVTRTNHPGGQKRGFGKNKKSSGKAKNILLTIIQKKPVVLTCPSKGLYPEKLRPLPGEVEAFTRTSLGLYLFRHIKDYQRKCMESSPYRRASQIFYLYLLRVSTKKTNNILTQINLML